MIPGNPPAVHFYELWKHEISKQLPSAQIMVSAYTRPAPNLKSAVAIDQVVQEHAKALVAFHRKVHGPLILLGHSLGGYVALKLLEQCSDLIEHAILIHPFLRSPQARGQRILRAARLLRNVQMVPKLMFRYRGFIENHIEDLRGVTNDELLTCLELAAHEHQTIAQDQSELIVADKLRPKIKVLYTKNDIWCTPHVVASLGDQVFTQECVQPHGFITSKRHRDDLFEVIAKALGPL
jgi:pimeloyl-ACP methyl ester carboxylesterase